MKISRPIKQSVGPLSCPIWSRSSPVFVLSTGRTGTDTLHHLFALSQRAISRHEPRPQLLAERQQAYYRAYQSPSEFEAIIKRARGFELLAAALKRKIYVETSARLTFLAPAIRALIPGSKFIYMFRHPGEIVRSGMRRGWYAGHRADKFRITPGSLDPYFGRWNELSAFEKICWYWSAYNRFALQFANEIARENCFVLRSEEFFSGDMNLIKRLVHFAGVDLPTSSAVEQVMRKKINAQQDISFPRFSDWTPEQRKTLLNIARPEIEALGYGESFGLLQESNDEISQDPTGPKALQN